MNATRSTFVLIHSPLAGPVTWCLVAGDLERRGIRAVVPSLVARLGEARPYWRQHVRAVATAVEHVSLDAPVVLVGHSGAGPLLPAVGLGINRSVAAYVFVDAGPPGSDGQSRLDLFEEAEAEQFRAAAKGGVIPAVWRSDDLLRAQGIADEGLRRRFAANVPDVPLEVYEEALPVSADWPDAPCAYLEFSAPYRAAATAATTRGWPHRTLPGCHFHMLVDPAAVTDALLGVIGELDMGNKA